MTGTITAKYRYDDFGKLKEIQKFNTADENGKENSSVLDALGNLFGINNSKDQEQDQTQNPGYHEFYAYNAESYNPNTEMQYLRVRYYKPETANFLTEDSYLGDILKPLTLNRYNYCAGNPVNYKGPSGNVILAVEFAKIGAAIGLVAGLGDAIKDAVEVGIDCYQNNKNFFEEYNWAAERMHVLNATVSGAVAGGMLGLTGNLELSMAAGEASYELLQGLTDVSTGAEDTKDLKNAKDVAGYVGKRVEKGAIRGAAEGALFDISLAAVNPLAISSAEKLALAGGYSAVGAVGMRAAAEDRSVLDLELLIQRF